MAVLTVLALACGPAARQPAPDESAIAQPPAQATNPTPTARPTRTPYPTDYIKPTDLPTYTPFPTLPPDPTSEVRPFDVSPKDVEHEDVEHAAAPTLAEQVTRYVRDEMNNYDVVARVRVLSHRTVPANLEIDWPGDHPPYYGDDTGAVPWRRTKIQVVEAFHGRLPEGYELLGPTLLPNASLEANREYILFIWQGYVGDDDFPGEPGRNHFNEEQMEAFGGKGGWLMMEQAWVIEGSTAWRMSKEHFWDVTPESNLTAAKAGGESLPVSKLVKAINAGVE